MSWELLYTKQAQKDAKKLAASKLKKKAKAILEVIEKDPYQNPPPYEKLIGDLGVHIQEESIYSIEWYIKFMRMSAW